MSTTTTIQATSTLHALAMLNALQSHRRIPKKYGPGFFYRCDWVGLLSAKNRKVSLRLARVTSCIRCGGPLPVDSAGDHIIPTSRGGEHGAGNFLPLCRSCNSSKGSKDLLDWWLADRSILDLNLDALCSYVRLRYQVGGMEEPATPSMLLALEQFREVLSCECWQAVVAATRGTGRGGRPKVMLLGDA